MNEHLEQSLGDIALHLEEDLEQLDANSQISQYDSPIAGYPMLGGISRAQTSAYQRLWGVK